MASSSESTLREDKGPGHSQAALSLTSWMDGNGAFLAVITAVALWKLFAGAFLGLIFDECYYWFWALHPQACYFDHPPLTAWAIAAGRLLFGHSELAVRFWAVASGVLLAVAGRLLGRDLFGTAAGNRAGILLALAPVFAGNAFLMTPDTLLVLAWAFALLFAWRGSRAGAPMAWWMAAGASAGVGMLSKYTMVLLLGGLGVLWLVSPGNRKRLFLGGLISGCVALVFFLPVLLWNAGHDWISFAHQLNHGFRNEHRTPVHFGNLAEYAGFLVILVSPVLGLLCFRTAVARMADDRFRFLGVFFWTVVLFFGFSAAKAHIEANWPMAAFVSGLIMVAGDWERYGVIWRRAAVILLLTADLGAFLGISYLLLPARCPLSARNIPSKVSLPGGLVGERGLQAEMSRSLGELKGRLGEFLGPREAAEAVESIFRSSGADFLCLSNYQLTGVVAFYAPALEPMVWLPDHGRSRFPWIDDKVWEGKTGLAASWPRLGPDYSGYFDGIVNLPPVLLPGAGAVFFYLGHGYRPGRVPDR